MRILHTSDWHIGRSFHGHSTLDALGGVLDALVHQVREHAVDLVVVAGDVFDSAAPSAACYPVLSGALAALADAGARVVVTSGNHDSAARLGFQSALLRDDISVLTDPTAIGTPVTFTDDHGPVHVYGIPYLEPAIVRHLWPGVELRSQAQTMAHALDLVRADAAARGGRSVVAAHCFAAGVESTPGVEREIRQGGLDVVPLSAFNGPDYVALGHIHGRQTLSERVRYAGAPLHYSFGEAGKPRGSWLVELDASGLASVDWLDLPVPRPLLTVRGRLDDLLTDERLAAHADHWVRAEYTDSTPQPDPMRRLQARFPWCATVVHLPADTRRDDGADYSRRVRGARDDAEVVDAFLEHVREGEGASPVERELIRSVLDARSVAEARA
ncbi:exonuclease SbcCD subunit D [Microbacterium sp. VKM Ac-2923]|uniref:exonuclease SbcCD subunit D n=1 Tax=Microbacterium sp. VKM Ac-2923 TaxID=2929476 RepID=UPI001FB247AF|nr:exonuclease SbcCD subunit D [Microbacterium sp. VKM Ac-2923]MCJ1707775.1 exonuclease SbcCD subunit D [Microbacterium sp. VKM Ac-2923]